MVGGPVGWIGGGAVTLAGATMSVVGVFSIYTGGYQFYDLLQEQQDKNDCSNTFFGSGVDLSY
jgi:hypothetical protein